MILENPRRPATRQPEAPRPGRNQPGKPRSGGGCCQKPDCSCPQCLGLECFERPRFYAGQLLTESELNGLSDYLRAKNRLHNLHLHGWGVVCGLGVTCHPCEGWVTIESGYALDPCGNDIVVCEPHDVNVAEIIRQCKKARKRVDCERPRQVKDRHEIEHWCLTLRYTEWEARPKAVLRKEDSAPQGTGRGGSCGCGGHGGGSCGCGGHGGHGPSASCDRKPGGPCEPTRVLESYQVELCQADGPCDGPGGSAGEQAWVDQFLGCFENLRGTFTQLPRQELTTLGRLTLNDGSSGTEKAFPAKSRVQIHTSFCRVRDALRELIRRNPPKSACYLLEEIDQLECQDPTIPPHNPPSTPTPGAVPAPPLDTSPGAVATGIPLADVQDGPEAARAYWMSAARKPTRDLAGILVRYLVDCLCHATLPPCAPCCDDEVVVLACMEVRDGRVLRICNHSCRRLAGAFPPSLGGVYLGPMMPIVTRLLGLVCCGDPLAWLLSLLKKRSTREKTDSMLQNNFAQLRFAGQMLARAEGADLVEWTLNRVFGATPTPEDETSFDTLHHLGQSPESAEAAAKKAGIELLLVDAGPEAHLETNALENLWIGLRGVRAGERLVAYTQEGHVRGFARADSTEAALVEQNLTIQNLQQQLSKLQERMTLLDPDTQSGTSYEEG